MKCEDSNDGNFAEYACVRACVHATMHLRKNWREFSHLTILQTAATLAVFSYAVFNAMQQQGLSDDALHAQYHQQYSKYLLTKVKTLEAQNETLRKRIVHGAAAPAFPPTTPHMFGRALLPTHLQGQKTVLDQADRKAATTHIIAAVV